jgi:chemotaxis protein MotA
MQAQFLQVLRIAMVASTRGASPILAIEYGRRSIPIELRPSFVEMETAIRRDAVIPSSPNPFVTSENKDANNPAA